MAGTRALGQPTTSLCRQAPGTATRSTHDWTRSETRGGFFSSHREDLTARLVKEKEMEMKWTCLHSVGVRAECIDTHLRLQPESECDSHPIFPLATLARSTSVLW